MAALTGNEHDGATFGVAAVAYALPERFVALQDLEALGLLESGAEAMARFGFRGAHVSERPAHELALQALRRLIDRANFDPDTVDLLLYAGALPDSHFVPAGGTLDPFAYPASRLQYDAGLTRAATIGIGQTGCTGLMTGVALAVDFLRSQPEARRVLVVSADVLPRSLPREIVYNVISDGACALLVERDAPRNHVLGFHKIQKGYYWDAGACRNELVAAYFPTARTLVSDTLRHLGLAADDVALVLPHNVSLRSWQILLPMLGFPLDRLFADNIAAKGHVIAADNFINLQDAWDGGRIRTGDRLLLFTFGFGASWACLALEA